jgi:[ribosomal protein S18]-alanine N-acetyltransferase
VKIATLTIEHLAAMVAIDQVCFGQHWSSDTYKRELNSPNSHFVGLFAAPDLPDLLVGMGCFWAILDEAHVTMLAVHPDYRRQGGGTKILGGLLEKAVQIEMRHSTLEVRGSNTGAIQLYEKMGFENLGWRTKYYQNPEEDAVVMWLTGLQHPNFLANFLANFEARVNAVV